MNNLVSSISVQKICGFEQTLQTNLIFFLHLRSLSIFWDYKTQPIFSGIIQLHLTKSSLREILIPLCQPFLANTLSIMQKAPELRPKVLFKIDLLRLLITKKKLKRFSMSLHFIKPHGSCYIPVPQKANVKMIFIFIFPFLTKSLSSSPSTRDLKQ